MTDKATALRALIEKVEAEKCGSDDGSMERALGEEWVDGFHAFYGSLDHAKALHEAVLPGWGFTFYGGFTTGGGYGAVVSTCPNKGPRLQAGASGMEPARAWLLAVLKALLAQEEAHD